MWNREVSKTKSLKGRKCQRFSGVWRQVFALRTIFTRDTSPSAEFVIRCFTEVCSFLSSRFGNSLFYLFSFFNIDSKNLSNRRHIQTELSFTSPLTESSCRASWLAGSYRAMGEGMAGWGWWWRCRWAGQGRAPCGVAHGVSSGLTKWWWWWWWWRCRWWWQRESTAASLSIRTSPPQDGRDGWAGAR